MGKIEQVTRCSIFYDKIYYVAKEAFVEVIPMTNEAGA